MKRKYKQRWSSLPPI